MWGPCRYRAVLRLLQRGSVAIAAAIQTESPQAIFFTHTSLDGEIFLSAVGVDTTVACALSSWYGSARSAGCPSLYCIISEGFGVSDGIFAANESTGYPSHRVRHSSQRPPIPLRVAERQRLPGAWRSRLRAADGWPTSAAARTVRAVCNELLVRLHGSSRLCSVGGLSAPLLYRPLYSIAAVLPRWKPGQQWGSCAHPDIFAEGCGGAAAALRDTLPLLSFSFAYSSLNVAAATRLRYLQHSSGRVCAARQGSASTPEAVLAPRLTGEDFVPLTVPQMLTCVIHTARLTVWRTPGVSPELRRAPQTHRESF